MLDQVEPKSTTTKQPCPPTERKIKSYTGVYPPQPPLFGYHQGTEHHPKRATSLETHRQKLHIKRQRKKKPTPVPKPKPKEQGYRPPHLIFLPQTDPPPPRSKKNTKLHTHRRFPSLN
jgi:hypothetical protein